MLYGEKIAHVTELQAALFSLRPIDTAYLKHIQEKFRIEYNFHSNHLEGNSLTYNETRSLLFFNIVSGEKKKWRDYEEMKGHDDVLRHVGLIERLSFAEDIVKGAEFNLTQSDIRSLHKLMLREDYKKETYNPDTKQWLTELVRVGEYKQTPNHVRKKNGDIFFFAEPFETQLLMQQLVDRVNRVVKENKIHPCEIAALFHYKFIRIHPFSDGNGRIARIIMNMILMHFGYPLIIIPSDEDKKQLYYIALEQTDMLTGDIKDVMHIEEAASIGFFAEYLVERLTTSLERMIQGAKGEKILDSDDVLKDFRMKLEMKSSLLQDDVGKERMKQNGNAKLMRTYVFLPVVFAVEKFGHVLVDKYRVKLSYWKFILDGDEQEKSLDTRISIEDRVETSIIPLYMNENVETVEYIIELQEFLSDKSQSTKVFFEVVCKEKHMEIRYGIKNSLYSQEHKIKYGDVTPIVTEQEIMSFLTEEYSRLYL